MSKAFGTDFILVNDVRQVFYDSNKVPWVHLATVKRGLKEYCAFHKPNSNSVYIEEADYKEPGLFKKITDDNEFHDLYKFLMLRGALLIAGVDKEIKIANVKK
jgi:hypothetical protein